MSEDRSPYLADSSRLADVIAAIQATATYKYYKLDFAGWSDRISGDESQADHWMEVFSEHPEFFRLDGQRKRASLVWRRQHQKRFNVDTGEEIPKLTLLEMSDEQKKRVSRTPLGSDEIGILIKTAIDLHSRALEHKRELRWWVPAASGLAGVVIGAAIRTFS